jgi:ATP-dependent Clp protease ATP-binding subunit ClpC
MNGENYREIASRSVPGQELVLYYEDPRFLMTLPGRLLVRVLSYVGYLVLIAAAAAFLLSGIGGLRYTGVFLALFLFDRFLHVNEGDRPLIELPKKGKVNLSSYLRPKAFTALERAFDRGLITKQNFFLEVIRQLLGFANIEEGLRRLDVKPEEFKQKMETLLGESSKSGEWSAISKEDRLAKAEALVLLALEQASSASHNFIESSDLFSAMPLVKDDAAMRLFNIFGIEAGDLERALIFSSLGRTMSRRIPGTLGGFVLSAPRIRHRIMNRAWTSRPTPTLDKYSTDFTDLARQSQAGFLIGHKEEFERLVEVLARPINPNAILVGEAGIGKETVISHLAVKLVKDEVPQALFDKRLVSLELENLVAGAPPEELNARLEKIVEEIVVAGNIVLYIPNIHNLVRTSGTAYISAADALMPVIMSNAFPVVGSAYPRDFKLYIEPRSDFAGVFEVIRINEISEADAEKILVYDSLILERQFKVTISFGAVKKAVVLAKKYFRDKFLPSSAEELLKSALVDAQRRGEKYVGPERVISVAEAKVNIPIHEATEAEAQRLLKMEDIIHERMIDQEEGVKVVADAIREYRSGLSRRGGPIASFLFVGPTGVGKTELAKILARVQFGSEKAMVRFDMTEYQDKQSFFRFIGTPDGQTTGALTDAILGKPYSLILLDEFEKAFPDILNLFLQVFDDGRLTDNLGRTVDFQNTVIIATSNAHSDIINDALRQGQSMTQIADYLKSKLTDVFKPELINRFSRIVMFKNLQPVDLEKIVELNLKDIVDLVSEQGIKMEIDPAVIKYMAKLGFDPQFGARPLRRVIEERLRAPLAGKILEKKIGRGGRVKIVLQNDEIGFVSLESQTGKQ